MGFYLVFHDQVFRSDDEDRVIANLGGIANVTILRRDTTELLLDEPYLSLAPPKSTGRELFNLPWLNSKLGLFSRRPEDVQATVQQFTAATVAAAVRHHAPGAAPNFSA